MPTKRWAGRTSSIRPLGRRLRNAISTVGSRRAMVVILLVLVVGGAALGSKPLGWRLPAPRYTVPAAGTGTPVLSDAEATAVRIGVRGDGHFSCSGVVYRYDHRPRGLISHRGAIRGNSSARGRSVPEFLLDTQGETFKASWARPTRFTAQDDYFLELDNFVAQATFVNPIRSTTSVWITVLRLDTRLAAALPGICQL